MTSRNIGLRNHTLRLRCDLCEWSPPERASMETVELHFRAEHNTDKVEMGLVAACTCGADMDFTGSGMIKDYLSCHACGNTGYVKRAKVNA